MFDWMYRRVFQSFIGQFEDWLQKPENIEEFTKLTDSLFDRELKRMYSSLGAAQTVDRQGEPASIEGLLTGKGGISSKKLIALGLNWWMQKQKSGEGLKQGSLP